MLRGVDRVGVLRVGVDRVGVERGVLRVGVVLVGVDLVGVLRLGVLVGSDLVGDDQVDRVRVGVVDLVGSSSSSVVEDDPQENTRVRFGSSVSTSFTGAVSSVVTVPPGVRGTGVLGVSIPSAGRTVPGLTSPGVFPAPPGTRGDPTVPIGTIGGSGLSFTTGVRIGVTVSGVTTG